jgi:4-hydroxy-3-methylbut-2-enyl diphosphate reductase
MKTFDVPHIYRSPLITAIKNQRRFQDKMKKDFSPTLLDFGPIRIFLSRHFGFCYGVENAIEISFKTVEENPGKRIFLLSEMIHNPHVNAELRFRGVQFIQDNYGKELIGFEELNRQDIVIIPAFGTTLEIEGKLKALGIQTEKYNTTCPFVEKVWTRSEQIARKNYTIVVHGKPRHEETRATFSHAALHGPAIVVNDMSEAILLSEFILEKTPATEFYKRFKNQFSPGFDPLSDLKRIGVVNQTTMLASDTQAIADFLKKVMIEKYGTDGPGIEEHFADTRDTLCYATNDNQSAVMGMLETKADFALVIGGYNSSNTSHLVELCEEKLKTYFIVTEEKILSESEILHFDLQKHQEVPSKDYLPAIQPVNVLITSGASCPDAIVETVIRRLVSFFPVKRSVEEIISEWSGISA